MQIVIIWKLDFDNGFMFQLFRVNGTFRHYVRLSWQKTRPLRNMCSISFLIMELVRDFLAMKVIKTLQLLNFIFFSTIWRYHLSRIYLFAHRFKPARVWENKKLTT